MSLWVIRYEGGILMNGTVPYNRDPRELSLPFCHVKTHGDDGILLTKEWVLTRYQICQCFILDDQPLEL